MDMNEIKEIACAHGGDRQEEWENLIIIGIRLGEEAERRACAKICRDSKPRGNSRDDEVAEHLESVALKIEKRSAEQT